MDRLEISPVGDELGAAFQELAPLPKQLTASCLIILDEKTVFVAGGLNIGKLDFLSDLVRLRFTWTWGVAQMTSAPRRGKGVAKI